MRTRLAVLAFVAAGVVGAPVWADDKPARAPTAEQIAERVQQFYETTKTFQAKFKQTYRNKIQGVTKTSTGRVTFAKRGKLSFRYDSPVGNRVVSDGTTLRVYETENQHLYEMRVRKSPYPAALAFLEGSGKLTRDFTLRKLDAAELKMQHGFVLEGVPKEATPAYRKLLLYIDGPTNQVRRVLLLDEQGNRNRFDFEQAQLNKPVPDSEFQFSPPHGTSVVRL
jgi:outer membrane lipoprotein carrier protein